MQKTISVYKPIGKTPLECVDELKNKFPDLKDQKLAYAGRLDPMAEGLLLILVGDECKKREVYQKLPKTYTLTILFGFETDTYDLLGVISDSAKPEIEKIQKTLTQSLTDLTGTYSQKYPPYSSPRVNGKPLFYWARNNLLSGIKMPEKQITIESIKTIDTKEIIGKDLLQYISDKIAQVSGYFRQADILETWQDKLDNSKTKYLLVTTEISSSHGAYMRSIAHDLGKALKSPACAYEIRREKIGEFTVESAIKLFSEAQS